MYVYTGNPDLRVVEGSVCNAATSGVLSAMTVLRKWQGRPDCGIKRGLIRV